MFTSFQMQRKKRWLLLYANMQEKDEEAAKASTYKPGKYGHADVSLNSY